MRVYENPLLKLNVSVQDGRVQLDIEGALSLPAKPILKKINRVFADEKPILSGDDELIFSTWIPPIPGKAFDRMISAEIAALLKKRVPDQTSIGITMRCPNNCIHCGASDVTGGEELSRSEIEGVIDQALDLGTYLISFDGGEPMMRDDLPQVASYVDKEKAIATSFTSGYGLSESMARTLKNAGMYAVRVSLDGVDASSHDRMRGRTGAFADAISGIKNALEAKMLVDMFVVVSPENIDCLDDFYSLGCDLGVHEVSLYEIIAVGRWMDHEDEVITENDVRRITNFQKNINRQPDGPRVTAFPYFMGPDLFGCFAGRRWVHVTATGDVLPCAYTPLSFGNVRSEPLGTIWKRIGGHPAYKGSADYCMMRNPEFRERWIHSIPDGAEMPYRVG
ncbi:MAG: radical SAM protein [Euryarchaeota archaeon]|nr:MAG: Coenzyme PQQ synthesis protein E [ANME-2 cluster archaeon]MEA1864006.1 radical SAM protein [Euryarchaeota archaeon]